MHAQYPASQQLGQQFERVATAAHRHARKSAYSCTSGQIAWLSGPLFQWVCLQTTPPHSCVRGKPRGYRRIQESSRGPGGAGFGSGKHTSSTCKGRWCSALPLRTCWGLKACHQIYGNQVPPASRLLLLKKLGIP